MAGAHLELAATGFAAWAQGGRQDLGLSWCWNSHLGPGVWLQPPQCFTSVDLQQLICAGNFVSKAPEGNTSQLPAFPWLRQRWRQRQECALWTWTLGDRKQRIACFLVENSSRGIFSGSSARVSTSVSPLSRQSSETDLGVSSPITGRTVDNHRAERKIHSTSGSNCGQDNNYASCQGNKGQHTLRKAMAGICTKNSPHTKNIGLSQATQACACIKAVLQENRTLLFLLNSESQRNLSTMKQRNHSQSTDQKNSSERTNRSIQSTLHLESNRNKPQCNIVNQLYFNIKNFKTKHKEPGRHKRNIDHLDYINIKNIC